MGYRVGVDLGTTYTAAAVWRADDRRPEIVTLGARAAAMPSVVFIDGDGHVLVGEAAEARAADDPARIAREFKRRLGDPAPILLGGSPWSAEALLAEVLRAVLARVEAVEGEPPASVVLTHPVSWGPYKLEQFQQVVRLAAVDVPVGLVPEPVAAAAHYLARDHLDEGAVLAVYDLGGGTFDATVLRVGTGGSAEVLGQEGIDRFGGIDIDAAVFDHVMASAPALFAALGPDDPLVAAALGRVRADCRAAKEALSEDTQATVVVALPTGVTSVRITRAELEAVLRPQLGQTVAALQRALGDAAVPTEQVDRVLLVGGSSRVPAVAEAVAGALGRPVAVDADPKHAIALGATRQADVSVVVPRPTDPPAARDALAGEPAGAEVTVDPVTTPEPLRRARAGRPRWLAAAAVVVIIGAGAIAFATLPSRAEDPDLSSVADEPEQIVTIAGDNESTADRCAAEVGDGGPAIEAALCFPSGMTIDADGRLLVADNGNGRVRAIDADGTITTIAGNGTNGTDCAERSGDGGPATEAPVCYPRDVAVDRDGRILITDNASVRAVDRNGVITTIAGTGIACEDDGRNGNGEPATQVALCGPSGIAVDADGRILFTDSGSDRVRAIDTDGTIRTIAGNGVRVAEGCPNDVGQGGPATGASLCGPVGIAVDADGRILVTEEGNDRLLAIDTDGTITTIAGTVGSTGDGCPAEVGDGGPAVDAVLCDPSGVVVDLDGRILITETNGDRVRAIDTDGTITTIAGTRASTSEGCPSQLGDGGPATDASLCFPTDVVIDAGRILIADRDNHRLRAIG